MACETTCTFFYVFYVFFQNPKKHDFLRFFELLHTFSRTMARGTAQLHISDTGNHGKHNTRISGQSVSYVVNAANLTTVTPGNRLFKYADDTYIVIPASNVQSRVVELEHVAQLRFVRLHKQTRTFFTAFKLEAA